MERRKANPIPSKPVPVKNSRAGSGDGDAGGVANVALPLSEHGAVPLQLSVNAKTRDAAASTKVLVVSWNVPNVKMLSVVFCPFTVMSGGS